MKVTFTFLLPEEDTLYDLYRQAPHMYDVLVEFENYLRETLKYNSLKLDEKELAVYDKIRNQLLQLKQEYGVSLD